MKRITIEVCAEGIAGARAALEAGVRRIELCTDLAVGGTTPSAEDILAAVALGLEVVVLIRPRAGDFCFDAEEFAAMRDQITSAARAGASGVALGALTREGCIDAPNCRALIEHARPLQVCFHRAFDETRDTLEALETLVELGVDRMLTSGGALDVVTGLPQLARIVERAGERLEVVPGGGVRRENIREVVEASGARSIHFSARTGSQQANIAAHASEIRSYIEALEASNELNT